MPDKLIFLQRLRWQRLKDSVEVRDPVLSQQTDQIETSESVFPIRRPYGAIVVGIEGLQLREVAIKGGDVFHSDTPKRPNFQDVTCNMRCWMQLTVLEGKRTCERK